MNTASYSLLVLSPDIERLDRIVVGLVCFDGEQWQVEITNSFKKILAVNPKYPVDQVHHIVQNLKTVVGNFQSLIEASAYLESSGSSIRIDSFVGVIGFRTEQDRRAQINAVFSRSINPRDIVAPKSKRVRVKTSRVRTKLRAQFLAMNLLGKNLDDLEKHKVISKFPINLEQGLIADFALKNTFMHITETLDFGVSEESFGPKNFEAQAKCLILKSSKEIYGDESKRYVVIAGGNNKSADTAVNLLSVNAELCMIESQDDMTKYFDAIQTAAKMGHISPQRHH